jgi:hypothetical protein
MMGLIRNWARSLRRISILAKLVRVVLVPDLIITHWRFRNQLGREPSIGKLGYFWATMAATRQDEALTQGCMLCEREICGDDRDNTS